MLKRITLEHNALHFGGAHFSICSFVSCGGNHMCQRDAPLPRSLQFTAFTCRITPGSATRFGVSSTVLIKRVARARAAHAC
jgi:hypothetical protein